MYAKINALCLHFLPDLQQIRTSDFLPIAATYFSGMVENIGLLCSKFYLFQTVKEL